MFKDKDDKVPVMISQDNAEYIVCTLSHKNLFQQPLDLNFTTGEEVTFFLAGHGKIIYLVCYRATALDKALFPAKKY